MRHDWRGRLWENEDGADVWGQDGSGWARAEARQPLLQSWADTLLGRARLASAEELGQQSVGPAGGRNGVRAETEEEKEKLFPFFQIHFPIDFQIEFEFI